MDETEVQVEIACWAQDHPEASTINWDNGNEPWVDFSGQRCTLHLGLGGLTWSIEVPTGYQTEVDPGDGKRKRLWDPLDYHDTVIVQSRNTPFHVSVVDHSNNTLELCNVLRQGFANKVVSAGSRDEVQLQKVHDKFKALHLESHPQFMSDTASGRAKKVRIVSNAFFETLNRAETLAEVLDGILGLAKFYSSHMLSSTAPTGAVTAYDPENDAEGTFLEEEDDEHLFDTDFTMKWSCIAAQVNHARAACAYAATHSLSPTREWRSESDVDFEKVSKQNLRGLPVASPSSSWATSETIFHLQNLTLASPPRGQLLASEALFHLENLTLASPPAGNQSSGSASSDSDDEYTVLLPRSLADSTTICDDSKQVNDNDDSSVLNAFQIETSRYDSDSDKSDSSWEIPVFCNPKSTSSVETKSDGERGDSVLPMRSTSRPNSLQPQSELEPEVSWPWDPVTKKGRATCRQSSDDGLPSKRIKIEQKSSWNAKELQWCEIAFNPVSFSVECTLRLSEFMGNPTVATALGFSLEHPLRVEIVPNKAQVDSLAWTGAVEVYVSQHSDWHNHISEEICGLLCLVPDIVQTYLYDKVPTFIRNHSDDLFVGLLQQLVRRLINVNAGGSCCVCGKPGNRPTSFHLQCKSLWPCSDNMCRARYATWEEVSSVDSQEREREENSLLRTMEETLRGSFSFHEQRDLKSALEVYGINADDMNYGQMIKALAKIELWNQKDPDSSALSYPVFEIVAGNGLRQRLP